MKRTTLILLSAAALLLTACDTTTSEEIIMDSDLILIINNIPSDLCDPNPLKDKILEEILPGATLKVVRDDNATVTCDTYDINAIGCEEVDYQEYQTTEDEVLVSCVIGASRDDDLLDYIADIVAFIETLID